MTQQEKSETFKALHVKGEPLVLKNIWDAGSARAVAKAGAKAGAKAMATGSWSVAAAHGYKDGEKLPLALVLSNLERIVATVDVPVSLDIEAGYSTTAEGIAETISSVVKAGAIGINLEDQIIDGEGLYSIEAQCDRIAAARKAADDLGIALFINARTDIYLKTKAEEQGEQHLEQTIERSKAYA